MSFQFFSIALVIFAVVFLGVGIFRVVEITSLELRKNLTRILIVFHIVGCLLFSAALGLMAMDSNYKKTYLVGKMLFAGLILLLPVHIFVGVKRRIKIQDSLKE
jgi:hypothetical protein